MINLTLFNYVKPDKIYKNIISFNIRYDWLRRKIKRKTLSTFIKCYFMTHLSMCLSLSVVFTVRCHLSQVYNFVFSCSSRNPYLSVRISQTTVLYYKSFACVVSNMPFIRICTNMSRSDIPETFMPEFCTFLAKELDKPEANMMWELQTDIPMAMVRSVN